MFDVDLGELVERHHVVDFVPPGECSGSSLSISSTDSSSRLSEERRVNCAASAGASAGASAMPSWIGESSRHGTGRFDARAATASGRWRSCSTLVRSRSRTRSWSARFARLLDSAGLPPPVFQHPVVLRTAVARSSTPRTSSSHLGSSSTDMAVMRHGSSAPPTTGAPTTCATSGRDLRRFTYEEVMRDGARVVRTVMAARARRQGFGDDSATVTVAICRQNRQYVRRRSTSPRGGGR